MRMLEVKVWFVEEFRCDGTVLTDHYEESRLKRRFELILVLS